MLVRYQSANLSDEAIIKNFVVRTDEFEKVISNIKSWKKGDSIQHYTYIGRRGSGKSTLLRRVEAEINTNTKLKKTHLVVNLSEEQAGIYQFYDLWDKIAVTLRASGLTIKEVDWQEYEDKPKEYSRQLFFALQEMIKKQNKQLVILIDNIDRILTNIKKDAHLFREFLINHNNIRIIGGSTFMGEDFYSYDKPFYEFFNIIHLKSLTKEELHTLIEHWNTQKGMDDACQFIKKYPGKVEAIRMLTDGLPRTMLLFLDMLIDQPEQRGFDYLRKILDEATPIYQERLGLLSPQKQKIVLELSFFWEAVTVEELVPQCKMSSKIISAQLAQLEKAKVVEKIKLKGSKMLYRLEERFFNMWLLMTQGGPRQKQQVKYLTIFLENWYAPEELQNIYNAFSEKIGNEEMNPDYIASYSKALAHSKHISTKQRDDLILKARTIDSQWIEELPPTSKEIYDKVKKELENHQVQEALSTLNELEQSDGLKHMLQGTCFILLKKYDEAEEKLKISIQDGFSFSKVVLALIQERLGMIQKAEKNYLEAITDNHFFATYHLAVLYEKNNANSNAEKYYKLAIKHNIDEGVYSLASLYERENKFDKAEEYYLLAIDKKDNRALNDLGLMYLNLGVFDKAEKYLKLGVDSQVPEACLNLILLYYLQNKRKGEVNSLITLNTLTESPKEKSFINFIHLWLGNMDDFHTEKNAVLQALLKQNSKYIVDYFLEILYHKQTKVVLDWFESEEYGKTLKEIALPTYYATQILEEKELEELKIPPELKENVEDIVNVIKKKQAFYYS